MKSKIEYVFGNVSPSGKHYNRCVSGYFSAWKVKRDEEDRIISEESVRINISSSEINTNTRLNPK